MPRPQQKTNKPVIEAEALSLEDWLSHVLVPENERNYQIVDYQFPTDRHRDEYLDGIHGRSESQVRKLLRGFLVPSGTLGIDHVKRRWVCGLDSGERDRLVEETEFFRRLIEPPFLPWDGVTWILDLLPDYPTKALDVLDGFFIAHCQTLPDGRMHGLSDSEAIIRRRYLQCDNPRESLLSLRPGEFEYLIGALFERMDYRVVVTKASRDGGVDVEARRDEPGGRAVVLVQCKRYESVVRVHAVRELMGVVARRQANKGIVVATCSFTSSARQEASENEMIELIDFVSLNKLLNKHFGSKWPERIHYEIRRLQAGAARPHP